MSNSKILPPKYVQNHKDNSAFISNSKYIVHMIFRNFRFTFLQRFSDFIRKICVFKHEVVPKYVSTGGPA